MKEGVRQYAVIFTSRLRPDAEGYHDTADRMVELAAQMPGFVGIRSARGADGFGVTVSYWESEEAIANWRRHGEHEAARERGRVDWYKDWSVEVAQITRAYDSGHTQDGGRND